MAAEVELQSISVDHSNHHPEWVVGNKKCVACIISTCDDASEANVKKRHFLAELVDIIRQNQCNVVSKLQVRLLAANHLIDVLFGLICTSDLVLADIASEGLITLFLSLKYENGVELTMRKITKSILTLSNIQECLPVVKLTGNLFKKLPYTAKIFMCGDGGSVLEVLSQNLSYPNESAKASILFLFVQLCKEIEWQTLNSHIKSQLIREVLKILKREHSRKLLINAFAMSRFLIQDEQSLDELFETTIEDATFPLILKKVLLCRECELQIAAVQCLKLALDQNNFQVSKANLIMENDVLEILFEILTTDNQILIDLILCCLLQFTQYENFFLKCHSTFGIEPIVRCTHQLFILNLISSLCVPLRILQEIFIRQPHGVTLFSTSFSMQLTISVLVLGINSSHRNISLEATRAVQYFLRKDILYLPIPFDEIKNVVLCSSKHTLKLFSHQWRIAARRKKSAFTQVQVTQEEKLLTAKLSLLHRAITLIKECGLDPVSFEDTFKPPEHNSNHSVVMEELTRSFLTLLDDVFMPTFLQNINLFYTCDVHLNIIQCLNGLSTLSSEITRPFFVFLTQLGFLEKLWDMTFELSSNTESFKELKPTCHELLHTMLVSLKYNGVNMDAKSLNIYNFNYCYGSLKECVLILNEYSIQHDVLQSQTTILEILYFHKLYSDCNVVDPIDLLEILSCFIHNVARIDLIPRDAFKCLLFLVAISFMESEQDFRLVESSIQIICTCLQTHFLNSLTHLYTHHTAFMFWVFSFPDLAKIFGYTAVFEWLKRYYSSNSNEDLRMFKVLLCENETCMDLFLNLVTENTQEIHSSIWSLLDELFSNLDCDLQVKTRSVLMDKFCNLALQGTEQSKQENVKSLGIILKIICKINSKYNSDVTLDLKVVQAVSNILHQFQDNEIVLWCCHYLNLIIYQTSENKDSRALAVVLSKTHVLEKIENLCKKGGNCVRYSALNLISALLLYQFKFKIQTSFAVKFELEEFQILLKPHQQTEIIQSAICLLSSLLKTSFKSTFFTLHNVLLASNLNPNAFRTIYILLQNIAIQNDETLKETVFKCIRNLLTFVQTHDEKLGVHLIRQPWIGIVLESQLKCILNVNYPELRSLFYLFLECTINNNQVGKFIVQLINYLSTEFHTFKIEEKILGMELITKISTSDYQGAVKSELRQELEQMLNIPEE